ncbi:RluA family pseudouridine synthase [Paenibacillus kobensis]|uniref:RluA family pseudouridine synthase n=1 Tax=Paenibacillus kobensis TaxID=59841 RepID=UPI000FDB79D3|nr:RluA family pseudouridine synthase [Paenibacillus kobensis]
MREGYGSGLSAETEWPQPDSHPHTVRQWLIAQNWFPVKWVNLLFSVGGIRMAGDQITLEAFRDADPAADALYRMASLPQVHTGRYSEAAVLFEDDHVLVMDKPAGMAVHPSRQGERGTLDEAAARHLLLRNDPLPVRHIHRLDNETSGPVLYSKNDLAQLRLDEAMRSKSIDRIYAAFVHGTVRSCTGTIDAPIGRDRHHAARRRVVQGGDPARTHYEVLEQYRDAALVRLKLETGRTHQIRVHMSHIGHPLIGDSHYGGKTQWLAHQALHGERLLFTHPLHGGRMETASPYPDWFVRLHSIVAGSAK